MKGISPVSWYQDGLKNWDGKAHSKFTLGGNNTLIRAFLDKEAEQT